MKTIRPKLALLLLALPLALSMLGGCTVVYEDHWRPHHDYWR